MTFKKLLKRFVSIFFKVKITGQLPVIFPDKKIYICNHQSMIDAMLVSLFVDDKFYFVMDKKVGTKLKFSFSIFKNRKTFQEFIRNRVTQLIIKFVNVIKVDTESPYSIKKMIEVVNEGKSLLIFPEGKITLDGELSPIQPGTWFISKKTNATIIPLKINGLLNCYFSYIRNNKKIINQVTLDILNPVNINNMSKEDSLKFINSLLQ